MLLALYDVFESRGKKVSGNVIFAMARIAGYSFRSIEAKRVLAKRRASGPDWVPTDSTPVPARVPQARKLGPDEFHTGSTPGPDRVPDGQNDGADSLGPGRVQTGSHKHENRVPDGSSPGLRGRVPAPARIPKVLVKSSSDPSLTSDSSISSDPSLFTYPLRGYDPHQNGKEKTKVLAESQADAEAEQLPWVVALREATNLIADTMIRDLTSEERAIMGRYFSWRFSRCSKSESKNITFGAKAASGFAKMADSKIFATFTIREYIGTAVKYQRIFLKGRPFFDPFAVRAEIEAQPIAAGARR